MFCNSISVIYPLSFSGDQIRMDRRRFYAMSAQHLGYYALPQVDLGGGSSRNMAGGFNQHLSSIKHFSFFHVHSILKLSFSQLIFYKEEKSTICYVQQSVFSNGMEIAFEFSFTSRD